MIFEIKCTNFLNFSRQKFDTKTTNWEARQKWLYLEGQD